MKKHLLNGIILSGLLLIPVTLMGQYTGLNPDVALGSVALAEDSIAGFEPSKAVDGLLDTYCAVPGAAPAWLQVDLGLYHEIDGFGMYLPRPAELPTEFSFQVSQDGADWTEIDIYTVSDSGTYGYDIVVPDPIRYVRFNMTSKDNPASFAEINVFGTELLRPVTPTPLPATDVTESSFMAHWQQLSTADGYVIRVATDDAFTELVPGFENKWVGGYLYWTLNDLEPGTTYYYRLRAYNLAGSSTWGTSISVTTLMAAQDISFDTIMGVTYGVEDFDLTATASSGLDITYSSSDEGVAVVTGSTVSVVGAGMTTITASQEGNSQYYPAEPVTRILAVEKKELAVSGATAESKAYDGTTDAVISGAQLDGVVGDDNVHLTRDTVGTFMQADIGTGISVSVAMDLAGADQDNYTLAVPGLLTADITPRELTVTAEDESRTECAENPEWTLTYSGFAEGEDASILTEEPVASCSADAGSPDGSYEISVSGGSAANYMLVYVPGTLTVTPDDVPPVLAVQDITIQIGENEYVVLEPGDLVTDASDNCTLSDTTLSQTLFTIDDVGMVNVQVTLTDASGNETTETAVVTVENSVGIDGRFAASDISLYPNPTRGIIHLDMNRTADELKVMDMTGRMIIRRTHLTGENEVIDLSGYPHGLYLIQIRSGEETVHFNVVKE